MPLTETGRTILRSMQEDYGSKKKGKQVFYATKNKKNMPWDRAKKPARGEMIGAPLIIAHGKR